MIRTLRLPLSIGARALAVLLSIAIALFSYRYLFGGPLRGANILANAFAQPFLVLHVAGAATALLVGPFQFIARFRNRRSGLHRIVGRCYVLGCLLGGAAGLPLALGSTAGPVASAGFGALSISWLAATLMGWRRAVQGRVAEHRMWMLRSWAMTFAAVTLRVYLPLSALLGLDPLNAYRAIAWLCWTGNLAALELYLRRPGAGAAAAATGGS